MRTLLLTACALALFAALPRRAPAQEDGVAVFAGTEPRSFEAMLDALAKADVVFLGEEHNHGKGHALELAILQGLQARASSMALSLEMFERDVQLVLDEYLAGQISESSFLQASRPWPNYKTDYRPLVEFCREKGLPVLAANAPRRYVNMVSRNGADSLRALSKAARAFLPPLPYAMDLPEGYDRRLSEVFGAHGDPGTMPGGMPSPANMKQAQGLWDAAMADSLHRFLRSHRGARALHVNGSMHSDYGFGVADRLRKLDPRRKVVIVSIKPDAAYPKLPSGKYEGVADFLLLTPVEKP